MKRNTLFIVAGILLYNIAMAQNVGIGTTTPQAKLEIKNAIRSGVKIRSNDFKDTTQLIFSNRNSIEQGTDFTISSNKELGLRISTSSDIPANNEDSILLITPTGNIGVNNTIPAERLDVRGNINVTGTIKANGTDGAAGQVLMKSNGGNLIWGDMNDYKNMATFVLPGANTWTVPAGVTKILVELWGGGGGGNIFAAGGGGGYGRAIFTVTPSDIISYNIGAGGAGGAGGSASGGANTQVTGGVNTVTATGGLGSTVASGTTMVNFPGGVLIASGGFTNYFGMRGGTGYSNVTTYIQSGTSSFLEVSTGGSGGDGANSDHTGGVGAYRVVDASAGTTIRYSSPAFGKQPGGGGGAGYSMLSVGGFGGGSFGGDGMVVIHY